MRFLFALASLASAALATAVPSTEFKCPTQMSYCPWTKSCVCPPGKSYDLELKVCVGVEIKGAWPEPSCDAYHAKGVELGKFCAKTPTKFVPYDAKHEFCQARTDTVVFCAAAEIDVELKALGLVKVGVEVDLDVEIDVTAKISETLKHVCAGLAGLYLEVAADAVALFNTNDHGLITLAVDVEAEVSVGLLAQLKAFLGLDVLLGVGKKAPFDCVSYCTKGCKNYIDVDAAIGAQLNALVGLVVLPDILLVVKVTTHEIVTVTVEGLLCIVGRVIKAVLSLYNCGCKN